MDFTREPIIETVITPKEGFKLVVRSSKSSGQEEYFVEAVEVVSFGNSFFFRSQERPKSFLVPVSDYEILEVREARMVLKNVGLDRSIKIGGGRDMPAKQAREPIQEKIEAEPAEEAPLEGETAGATEGRVDKRRDRRRHSRRRRGRDDLPKDSEEGSEENEGKIELPEPLHLQPRESSSAEPLTTSSTILSSILPPPPTLISETIARYKDNAMFKGAFFMKDEDKEENKRSLEKEASDEESIKITIDEPHLGPFAITEEEEEDIYKNRENFIPSDDAILPSEENAGNNTPSGNHTA